MIYPQLVQYGPGLKIAPDWATSWEESKDGLTWTFHLKPGGKWSDGVPLTAEDAVWWVNTIFKYQNGATSYLAGELAGLKKIAAPDPNTLVLTYKKPVPSALANLEQFYFMPKHVWSKYTGNDGKDMKSFNPEQHLPVVSGGPYTITQFQEKGTTVFKPNPYFYGPKSHVAAVALTYYTNATSMIADLEQNQLDFIDATPYTAADSMKGKSNITVSIAPGSEVTNLGINSNPVKPKNRELLDPPREGGVRVRDPAPAAGGRRLRRPRPALGQHHVRLVGAVGLAQPGREAAALRRRQGQPDTRSARLHARLGRHPGGARHHRPVRPAGPPDELQRDRAQRPRLQRRPPVLGAGRPPSTRSACSCTRSPAATCRRPTT